MNIRDGTHMTSMKIIQFSRPLTPLSIYVQNSFTPLTLDVHFQKNHPLLMITNHLKENIIQGLYYYMLSDLSFRSAFVFSINSLVLSGFPLTSFHLAEASLSAFSWLYTLVSSIVQKYHEMLQLFTFLVLILQSTCFICTT